MNLTNSIHTCHIQFHKQSFSIEFIRAKDLFDFVCFLKYKIELLSLNLIMYALVNRDFVFVLKKRRQGNDIYHHNRNEAHHNQEPPIENYIERDFNSIDAINIDEEQKEAIYDEEGSSGSRELPPIFIPFRNFRRNQMVPGPNLPAQHMPQLSSNRRSGLQYSISYENDV